MDCCGVARGCRVIRDHTDLIRCQAKTLDFEGNNPLEYRTLGGSGFKIPALIFGTATFGGGNEFFKKWGSTDVKKASSLIDAAW